MKKNLQATRKFFVWLLLFIPALMLQAADYQAPALKIKGQNIGIDNVKVGRTIFYNRSVTFTQTVADMDGWNFVRLNAYSTYNPGPAAVLSAKAEEDGYFYTLVADVEKPDVCKAWAAANGWEKQEGVEMGYGAEDVEKLHLYRKACTAGEWVDIVQPQTFSGALLIAPTITMSTGDDEGEGGEGGEGGDDEGGVRSVAISLHLDGWAETDVLHNGTKAFANRTFVYMGVPSQLDGMYITRINGGVAPVFTITCLESGDIYIAHWANDTDFNPDVEGWERHEELDFHYNDGASTCLNVYSLPAIKGDVIVFDTKAWTGIQVLSSKAIKFDSPDVDYEAPNMKIKGKNIGVAPIALGQLIYYNREMTFQTVDKDFEGWSFVRLNANSSYRPGPAAQLSACPDADGYFYVMVADVEKPDICKAWATANGWEKMDGPVLSYSTKDVEQLYVYRKPCQKDVWVDIVQPETFSGAMLMAPSLEFDNDFEAIQSVAVSIKAMGWMETVELRNGTKAFGNRDYVYQNVNAGLEGLQVSRYNGGDVPNMIITVEETGKLYIGHWKGDTSYDPAAQGWTAVDGYDWNYNDGGSTTFNLWEKDVTKGDVIDLCSSSWTGVQILSSKKINVELEAAPFLPVPGVVIHNSPTVTGKFVGSPSITILPDGTYLASHDYFGGFLSDTYIYESHDRGETWERIAHLDKLTWGKLFTRGDEVYILGVQPRVAIGYGNIVIYKSTDGGHTWTNPTNSKNGLLKTGYFHTAPTPVIEHNGRLWKCMENQGSDGGWGPFSAFALSIPADTDLLVASNWTYTNELRCTAGAVNATTWLEGNAVVTPEGKMVDILRLDYAGDDRAAVARISDNGKTISYNAQKDVANVPGACKKFTIRYDSISNRYWTLSNYIIQSDRAGGAGSVRNNVALCWSTDLMNWTVQESLLYVADYSHCGFQYLDWQFDGDDIIAVSRTAWQDETGKCGRQHDANYLTFHRFRNFRYATTSQQTEGNDVSVSKWMHGARSAMALTFDDGFDAHHKHVLPILNENDIKSTFYVITNELSETDAKKGRYASWAQVADIAAQGHEVGSHTLTHPNLSTGTFGVVRHEVADSKAAIEAHTGVPCLTLAYPYCLHNQNVDVTTELAGYIGARDCDQTATAASLTPTLRYGINANMMQWKYPRSLSNEQESYDAFVADIQRNVIQKGDFGVACIHEVLPFDRLSESDTYEVTTTEWLTMMCQYLSAQREAGNVWPTTLANIIRYADERDHLHTLAVESEDSVVYSFTTRLDTTIYNLSLTITLPVPEGWENVSCAVIEGDAVVSEMKLDDEATKVVLDVVPDRQQVVISRESTPTALNVKKVQESLRCSPNPCNDVLTLFAPESNTSQADITIYGANGTLVSRYDKADLASGQTDINVSRLPVGHYILQLRTTGASYSARFLKK